MKRPLAQHGLTLVELMVAMVIGLALLAGVIQMFVSSRQIYRAQDAMARIQENGRFAIDLLAREARGAGGWGCGGAGSHPVDNGSGNPSVDRLLAVAGIQGVENGMRDELFVGGAAGPGTPVSGAAVALPEPFSVSNSGDFAAGDFAILSDCRRAEIFRIAAVRDGGGTLIPADGTGKFGSPASVYRVRFHRYFIKTVDGVPTLQRESRLHGRSEPLIDGIEAMQILYGEDRSGDRVPDIWASAAAVRNPAAVTALRIHLLARSAVDHVAAGESRVFFAGAWLDTADHRLRQSFTTTIDVRNR